SLDTVISLSEKLQHLVILTDRCLVRFGENIRGFSRNNFKDNDNRGLLIESFIARVCGSPLQSVVHANKDRVRNRQVNDAFNTWKRFIDDNYEQLIEDQSFLSSLLDSKNSGINVKAEHI